MAVAAQPDGARPRRLPSVPALAFLARRLAQSVLVVLGAVLISFVLVNLSGNSVLASKSTLLTPAQLQQLEQQLGFDRPLPQRLVEYLGNVVQGDFGTSYRFGGSALGVVLDAMPNTLLLVAGALIVALGIGIPAALYSAIRRDTRSDRWLRRAISVCQGIPEFWLGLVLVLLFSVKLGAFPSIGFGGPDAVVLPVIALAVPLVPAVFRLLRGQLLDVLGRDFVEALRIRGMGERRIVVRHAARNALPGFVTYLALQIGYLLGGTLIVEVVFGWPGIGSLTIDAVKARDLGVVQAVVVSLACVYVLLNLLADLAVLWLDPRVRRERF
jgi:ABC-type dipeptide/oligopeptide/nickel transport system permease component